MGMNPRLLRPTASGFDPRRIAGLQLWLDGSDSAAFTLNGSTVSEWRDKSGNARHFVQATAAQQPAITTGAKNGRAAVAFTNDWMTGVYTYGIGSIFVVWEQPTTTAGDGFPAVIGQRTSSSTKVANGSLAFGLSIPDNLAPNNISVNPGPAGASYRLNGLVPAASFTTLSGVAARTSPDRWQHMNATFSPVSGSQSFVLGADPFTAGGRVMQNGHIGEILIYDTALSAAQVTRVTNYLIARWGLQ